jgi:hypothetical protein
MEEETEAAFEAARDVRTGPLPRAPFGERADLWQVVAIGQLFDQQVRQGRRGLSDRESRMPASLDQRHALATLEQAERRQRSTEAGSDDGDVRVDVCNGKQRHRSVA